jgi:tetratricopeptide (TPR) repeat protein
MENLRLLFQIYVRPAFAMSEIMDRGSWLFVAAAVFIVSMLFFVTINAKLNKAYRIPALSEYYQPNHDEIDEESPDAAAAYKAATDEYSRALSQRPQVPVIGDRLFDLFSFDPTKFYEPVILLSMFYVPLAILLISIFAGIGNFGIVLRRDYGALSICTLSAWAMAHLPFGLAGLVMNSLNVAPQVYFWLWIASGALFGVFMIFALRTVFGASYGVAILVVSLAWLALSLGMYVFRFVSPWMLSPFLLFWVVIYFGGFLRGEARGFGNTFRQRQNFKRFLHNATVNPRDADAHVQLGMIYLERRQETRALEHLNKAIEIDPNEIDANYELGKLARRHGDLQKAIEHFSKVVEQNDKHALSEIWREIGATYLDAGMFAEAREALEKFVERRPVDAEGLYYFGKVLKSQGESERAREMFEQAVDSAKTSPEFRRRGDIRHWSKMAKREL